MMSWALGGGRVILNPATLERSIQEEEKDT